MKNIILDLRKKFSTLSKEIREINKSLYNHPEIGLQEFNSSKKHCEFLERNGFYITKQYCNIETAFLASYSGNKSGPKIAFLAEYDALPDIGHGCGHNISGLTSSTAGILLKEYVDKFGGTALVIGTPAEETHGAKVVMVSTGIFDDVDVALLVHAAEGNKHLRSTSSQAMDAYRFIFRGRTSHAASSPQQGINALDGVLNLFNSLNALRQQILGTDRIHGIISNGGEAANIIPDLAVADFYIRSKNKKDLKSLREKVFNCAKGAALASGTTLEIENYETNFLDLVTNSSLMNIYEESLNSIGITEIGDGEIGGSTDMGDVSQVCPSIHPYMPLYKNAIPHSKAFASATIEDDAYKGMEEAVLALVLTGIKLLKEPKLLNEIKEDFKNTVD